MEYLEYATQNGFWVFLGCLILGLIILRIVWPVVKFIFGLLIMGIVAVSTLVFAGIMLFIKGCINLIKG